MSNADTADQALRAWRREEDRARTIEQRILESRALAPLAGERPELVRGPVAKLWRKRRALLIVNSKSGPNRDTLSRARELVELLAEFHIRADVRIKLRKKQARKEARAAARRERYDFVIAAGGDGTVEAVASGLLGTHTTLGIIPLGTFNNVATSLGIPADLRQACALIACGATRRIDVGLMIAKYMNKPRVFLEMSTVGLGAVAGVLGQHVEKGRWKEAAQALPGVAELSPTPTQVRLDDGTKYSANTLLITISNTPRAGAGLKLAPFARLDDGLLDIRVYQGLDQAALMGTLLPTLLNGSSLEPEQVWRGRARSVEVHTAAPMPVSIESKLVGVTPARFTLEPGALSVVVGDTEALLHPAAPALVHASRVAASARGASPTPAAAHASAIPVEAGLGTRALQAVVPVAGRGLEALTSAQSLALPLATAAVGLAAGTLFQQRRRASLPSIRQLDRWMKRRGRWFGSG